MKAAAKKRPISVSGPLFAGRGRRRGNQRPETFESGCIKLPPVVLGRREKEVGRKERRSGRDEPYGAFPEVQEEHDLPQTATNSLGLVQPRRLNAERFDGTFRRFKLPTHQGRFARSHRQ